ncbi:glutaredoxin-like protein [Orenia metallireducens]|uniref:Glutaredoxin-like domain protein n=1 Tax=Orenia metallireducens TaxID=1413210 RepID=A0A285GF60_9FIRM|nr:thioredoxin family protein [Orenia metallireducens]PRX30387.1 glutaredoxin-like protein [Orenia metallireducens]SNY22219.1 Glutaredoxin-like domain protein [Orenia metallireducens]
MDFFEKNHQNYLKKRLAYLNNDVKILFFTKDIDCSICKKTEEFLKNLVQLSDKLSLKVYNYRVDKSKSEEYDVHKAPAILILDKQGNESGIRFYTKPTDHQLEAFIKSLLLVSGNGAELPERLEERVAKIDEMVHIQIFADKESPDASQLAEMTNQLALANKKIRADMIETTIFDNLADNYNISRLPKVMINNKREFVGLKGMEDILEEIERVH